MSSEIKVGNVLFVDAVFGDNETAKPFLRGNPTKPSMKPFLSPLN